MNKFLGIQGFLNVLEKDPKPSSVIKQKDEFQNEARQVFSKTNISYPLIRGCAIQGIRNVRFSENSVWFVFFNTGFEICPFALLPKSWHVPHIQILSQDFTGTKQSFPNNFWSPKMPAFVLPYPNNPIHISLLEIPTAFPASHRNWIINHVLGTANGKSLN